MFCWIALRRSSLICSQYADLWFDVILLSQQQLAAICATELTRRVRNRHLQVPRAEEFSKSRLATALPFAQQAASASGRVT